MSLLDPNDPLSGAGLLASEQAQRQQEKIAAALLAAGKPRQMTSPWQAVAQGFEGALAGLQARDADRALQAGVNGATADFGGLTGSSPAITTPMPVPSAQAEPPMAKPASFANVEAGNPKADIANIIANGASAHGVDPNYMTRLAMVESGGNPTAANPNSSAKGLFQFIGSTGKQYGLADPFDPVASTDAAARFTLDNKNTLTKALGREPTPGELYLAHQQGAGGAIKILANPDAPAASIVGNDAIRLNGGSPGMTAGQFAQKWTGKFADLSPVQKVAQAMPQQTAAADLPAPGAEQAGAFVVPGAAGAPNGVQRVAQSLQTPQAQAAMRLLSNPYASAGQKLVAKAILDQTMKPPEGRWSDEVGSNGDQYQRNTVTGERKMFRQAPDPLDQDLKRKSLAKSDAPTSVQEYEYAKGQGYTGSFSEYELERKRAGAINVKTEGTIPPDYRAIRDANGNISNYEVIPGSKTAREMAENEQKISAAEKLKKTYSGPVFDALNDVDRIMKDATFPTTGGVGKWLSGLPGTSAHDVANQLETIKGNIAFDRLQAMRAASPTGGALGAVSDHEQKMLSNAFGALEQSQSEKQFKINLRRVRRLYNEIINGDDEGGASAPPEWKELPGGVRIREKR